MSNNVKQGFEHRIDELIRRIDLLGKRSSPDDDETISDLCRYMCILVSGYFEKNLISKLVAYANDRSSRQISHFVNSSIDRTTNLSKEKVESLLAKFDSSWNEQISKWHNFETYANCLGTIYGNRNKIAHGECTTISISTLKDSYNIFKQFFTKLDTIII